MKKRLALLASTAVAFAAPAFAFAQTTSINNLGNIGTFIISFINTVLVPVIFAFAFLVFIFGILQYFILGRGDEEKAAQGRQLMLWGIIGFFVMLSVYGLVNILVGTFSLNNSGLNYPHAPTQ